MILSNKRPNSGYLSSSSENLYNDKVIAKVGETVSLSNSIPKPLEFFFISTYAGVHKYDPNTLGSPSRIHSTNPLA